MVITAAMVRTPIFRKEIHCFTAIFLLLRDNISQALKTNRYGPHEHVTGEASFGFISNVRLLL